MEPEQEYRLRLHFVEMDPAAGAGRYFHVVVNRQMEVANLNVGVLTGLHQPHVVELYVTPSTPTLHVVLAQATYAKAAPMLTAIEAQPSFAVDREREEVGVAT